MRSKLPNRIHGLRTILLFCTVIFLLFSCTKTENSTEEAADTGILTNLYRETVCTLPNAWHMSPGFTPDYDNGTGTFTIYAETFTETENTDGTLSRRYTGGFFTFDHTGTVTAQNTFELPENTQITHGMFTDDAVYCITCEQTDNQERKRYLHRYDLTTKETISTQELSFLLDTGMSYPHALCIDTDGDIFLASQEKIVILSPNLTTTASIALPDYLRSMVPDRNGNILVCTRQNGSWCAAAVNKKSVSLENAMPIDSPTPNLISTQPDDSSYAFYYLTDTFVWGMTYDEEGNPTAEPVMDLVNSGIGNTESATGASGVTEPCAAFERDTLLFISGGTPLLFRPSEDIDLETIRTITLAHTEPPSAFISSQIVQFNKDNPNVRVVTKDYSSYTTDDKPNGAEEQLTLEITAGLFRPDMVLGSTDSLVLEQIVQNGLYTDLVPYLETDDTVNFHTLYGCIPRTFDDGKGGMWAITPEFKLRTLIGHSAVLGKYAGQTSWTLDELLDFFESLPEDVEKFPELLRDSGVYFMDEYTLLAQGYGYFIDMDSGTCSFESDTFLRYLEFLSTLPATTQEWKQRSEYANLDKSEQFYAGMSGKVALKFAILSKPSSYWNLETAFGTKNYTLLGRATTTDSGAGITSDSVFTVTSFTKSSDTCWELLKYFFAERQPALMVESGFLSMKPLMAEEMIPSEEYIRVHYTTGVTHSIGRDPYNPLTEETLEKPGIILSFTDEDRRNLEEFLDNSGNPLIYEIPDAVRHIVRDEMSTYFGGLGTAEDCAKKIQSRVSIWLSENE